MKNITFSAEENLIEAARERAHAERTTLNDEFRRWLSEYARRDEIARRAMATIRELSKTPRSGFRKYSREEMNER